MTAVQTRKRRDLRTQFKDDDRVRVFLSTNAGGVGLNLQSGTRPWRIGPSNWMRN
jgi:SNF2 family DNA or RNA helicase